MSDGIVLPTDPKFKNLLGQRFGRLVVIEYAGRKGKGNLSYWRCKCDCGGIAESLAIHLRRGEKTNCGCTSKRQRYVLTGKSGTHEYKIWNMMVQRCRDSHHPNYRLYGARGIRVCQEWQDSFDAFLLHVGKCPASGYQLDRIDNDGHYEPGNVRWVDRKQNMRNRRNNVRLTINGETLCVVEWSERSGITAKMIAWRLENGWDAERAVFTPKKINQWK